MRPANRYPKWSQDCGERHSVTNEDNCQSAKKPGSQDFDQSGERLSDECIKQG